MPDASRKRKRSRSRSRQASRPGSRLRVTGEGEAGVGGGPTGDLYIVIHVADHEHFERQGNNLYSAVPIAFAQAALGAELTVRTLDGEEQLTFRPARRPARYSASKARECQTSAAAATAISLSLSPLVTPKTLTKEQRRLLEQLAEIEDADFSDESFMDKVRNIFG